MAQRVLLALGFDWWKAKGNVVECKCRDFGFSKASDMVGTKSHINQNEILGGVHKCLGLPLIQLAFERVLQGCLDLINLFFG